MTARIAIEEERGTFVGSRHPHNGYYAGDFRNVPTRANSRTREVRVLSTLPTTR